MSDDIIKQTDSKMDKSVEALQREFSGLRTGRASVNLLDPIHVDAYGSSMPLSQVASISVPESRMLTVQVWDAGMTKAVEKAISEAGLGLNPSVEGQVIRIPIPALSEERRQELTKVAGKYSEECRVSIRNVRREAMDKLKKMEKDSEISEDEHKRLSENVQKLTDNHIKRVDEMLEAKQKDIMKV